MGLPASKQPEAAEGMTLIDRPDQARAVLHPIRRGILARLDQPRSAAGLARDMSLPRQLVNYHLRGLERQGFVELVEERRKGNCLERIVRATARAYIINPQVLGSLGQTPAEAQDRFSSTYLIASAAKTIRDVAVLRERAALVRKRLATLTLEAEVRFATPYDQSAFAQELASAFAKIAAKHHTDDAPHGRLFRFTLMGHPAITKTEAEARAETAAAAEQDSRRRPTDDQPTDPE